MTQRRWRENVMFSINFLMIVFSDGIVLFYMPSFSHPEHIVELCCSSCLCCRDIILFRILEKAYMIYYYVFDRPTLMVLLASDACAPAYHRHC